MKNSDLWKQYDGYTKDLSDNLRKLGFAAAAISWFFKSSTYSFPKLILIALGFVVVFFILDILQYFLGAICIRFWARNQEKKKFKKEGTIEGDYSKPAWLDYPSFTMWWSKVIALLCGYFFIGIHILRL